MEDDSLNEPVKKFPGGFWSRTDFLLRDPHDALVHLARGEQLRSLGFTFFAIAILMCAIYGGVMGATNLLQSSEMEMKHKIAQIAITAIKVPALFLLTLTIVLPPVYVSNVFAGGRFSFGQTSTLLLASVAVTSIMLASMASVSFFFALTSISYHFIKLLHVTVFVYAGFVGLGFLIRGVRVVSRRQNRRTPVMVFFLWLILYMFVGTQLAWVLRPFVGSPNEPFRVFREKRGNFYESVTDSTVRMLRGENGRPQPAPEQPQP